jgi:lipoprotein-anchoring transpeptidase ErfK/SrfK
VRRSVLSVTLILICQLNLVLFTQNCQAPPAPSEVNQALEQEQDLWRAGASIYAPDDYENYCQLLFKSKKHYDQEQLKIGFFRDYDQVKENFRQVLEEGNRVNKLIEDNKVSASGEIISWKRELYSKYRTLEDLSFEIGQRTNSRELLVQTDVIFREVDRLVSRANYQEARARLDLASSLLNRAENILYQQLKRYMSLEEISRWRKMAEQAVEKSKRSNQLVIVVSKLEKRLIVYKDGAPIKTYWVGLGFRGLNAKLYDGDEATPEGEYKVIKKRSQSKFKRALLINYPNEEDQKKFDEARKRGYIAASARIGGQIEIHGGGKDGLTNGCIALDDAEMEELFRLVPVGTPVTIIGTTDPNNKIITVLKREKR